MGLVKRVQIVYRRETEKLASKKRPHNSQAAQRLASPVSTQAVVCLMTSEFQVLFLAKRTLLYTQH